MCQSEKLRTLYGEPEAGARRQHVIELPEDITQNMRVHGSITGKMMTRMLL